MEQVGRERIVNFELGTSYKLAPAGGAEDDSTEAFNQFDKLI